MKTLHDYILNRLANGKSFFTKQEATVTLGFTEMQFKFQAHRLSRKKIIKRLVSDFFMIIPAEYANFGSLPPHWIIDPLMNYLGLQNEYYIGLLSAASVYGATEQQPMVLQIIVSKQVKAISLKRSAIEFHQSKDCASAQKSLIKVQTGYAKISTSEQTMVDLVKFYKISGYLSNVALVIKSLAEQYSKELFLAVVEHEHSEPTLQRLGYIFEYLQLAELADIVEQTLIKRKTEYVLLRPDHYIKEGPKNSQWKIIENDFLELS